MVVSINWFNLVSLSWLCYPILGAFYVTFGLIWYRHLFKDQIIDFRALDAKEQPLISIMVAAHNEHSTLRNTIEYLARKMHYYNYEILILDDGSTDDTLTIAHSLQQELRNVRVIHISKNNGKAHALNVGIAFARGEFILSNDADTLPEPNALQKYMNYFKGKKNINVGAVTANMDVQNRTELFAKSQIVEFTSIVGGIKRTQASVAGSMFAFSGANTMYRKKALIDVGGFRQNRATEDISIAWDLNYYQWQTKFSPDIFFYMLVPDNAKDLYNQRKRWAQGGTEVWMANFKRIICHPILLHKQMSIYIDNTLSTTWGFLYFISLFVMISTTVYDLWHGLYSQLYFLWLINMTLVCLEYISGIIQLMISLHYDQYGTKMSYFWFVPLYVSTLWFINPLTIVVTFWRALGTIIGKHSSGTWTSPGR